MRTLMILAAALAATSGLEAQAIPDFTPPTPLFAGALRNDTETVKKLLAEGANPNEGRFLGFPAVLFPVFHQNVDMLRAMVKGGADLKATDPKGSTLLMWAAYNDSGNPEMVKELLRLGLDPNQKNEAGETALTWALRRGYTPVVDVLKKAGAMDAAMIKDAVEKAVAAMQKSGPQFVKVSGCVSCHHQSLPQMAIGIARERGFAVDDQISQQQIKAVMAMFRPIAPGMASGKVTLPNVPITVSYALLGLAAEKYEADDTTRAMAQNIAAQQQPDGSFRVIGMRPPLEASNMTATALSIRALQLYGDESTGQRVAKAQKWLASAEPACTEDRAMKLMGLNWSKADPAELRRAAQALLATQQADGGWAQLPSLTTDAYATGQALTALYLSGQVTVAEAAYQRGVAYLMRTQLADGTWRVITRSFPLQPYKESGFPHGKDQWISISGTSWAAMALSFAVEPVNREMTKTF